MNRDIKEMISRYDNEPDDQIYTNDIQQVLDISREEFEQFGAKTKGAFIYALVVNAMKAGYMIGYKKAKENN